MVSSFRPSDAFHRPLRLAVVLVLVFTSVASPATVAALDKSHGKEKAAAAPGADALLLVLNKSDDTLAFVDPENMKAVGTIAVGHAPHEIVVSPNGKRAYVADYGTRNQPGNTISVIDVPGRLLISTIDLGEFQRPHGLAISQNGRLLYVTVEENQAVLEIDTAAESISRSFVTNQSISHMCVLTPPVANIGSRSVTVIDLDESAVSQIEVGDGPEGIDVSPDGRFLWVANRSGGNVMVVDTKTDEIVDTMPAGDFPIRVKFTPNGKRVLISNARGNELVVFDAKSREKVGRIDTGEAPIGILVEPNGHYAWVAQTGSDRVSRLDLKVFEVVGHVEPGSEPDGLGWVQPSRPSSGKDDK
jgi:YVTN family beta-propeller protein